MPPPAGEEVVSTSVHEMSDVRHNLERELQHVRLPQDYNDNLRAAPACPRSFRAARLVHIGTSGATALHHCQPTNEDGDPLGGLQAAWYPSGISPQCLETHEADLPAGAVKFGMPTLRIGRKIAKTKLPPIQLTFNQAHNFTNTGGG